MEPGIKMSKTHDAGWWWWVGCAVGIACLSGCARVPVAKQGWVGKPNMVFSDGALFGDRQGLLGQIEPGASSTGGAQAAGCTSCK